MTDEPDLFDMPVTPEPVGHVGPPDGFTIEQAFWKFHRANPDVFTELVRLAKRWKGRGIAKCGIGMLFEVLRWRRGMKTGGDEFKLNNNYRALYARLIMAHYPDLDGLFEIRTLHFHRRDDD